VVRGSSPDFEPGFYLIRKAGSKELRIGVLCSMVGVPAFLLSLFETSLRWELHWILLNKESRK
jgi:hypothetical protein